VIEDSSITIFQIFKTVEDVCKDGGLHLEPAGGPFRLKHGHCPQNRGPAGLVRGSTTK